MNLGFSVSGASYPSIAGGSHFNFSRLVLDFSGTSRTQAFSPRFFTSNTSRNNIEIHAIYRNHPLQNMGCRSVFGGSGSASDLSTCSFRCKLYVIFCDRRALSQRSVSVNFFPVAIARSILFCWARRSGPALSKHHPGSNPEQTKALVL